jgi:hypothetical protein
MLLCRKQKKKKNCQTQVLKFYVDPMMMAWSAEKVPSATTYVAGRCGLRKSWERVLIRLKADVECKHLPAIPKISDLTSFAYPFRYTADDHIDRSYDISDP